MISQILLTTIMSLNSMFFLKMQHPMNMGILLLIQALMTCLLTGTFSQTSWFSYILFLVLLGGMLVLFIYMTSIASNETFQKSNYFLMIIIMSIITFILLAALFMDPMVISSNNTMESMNINNILQEDNKLMTSLYNTPMATITMAMVMYLLLTLIVIVFITKSHLGPLRPMN